MPATEPRGERFGWTPTEVSARTLRRFKVLIKNRINKILSSDPLPEEYELVAVTLLYRCGEKYDHDIFSVIAEFDKPVLSVFRLEGVKK